MYRLSGLFIITVSLIITGCAPVGSIGDIDYDSFWIISTRPTYGLYESLKRSDLSAFASFQGAVDTIPIDKVVIRIEDYPNNILEFQTVNGVYTFAGPGTKRIRALYNGMEAEYSIRVLDPNGGTTSSGPGSGGAIDPGGGSFISWW